MDNDKQFRFLSNMVTVEVDPEKFVKQICLFSQYLVYSNHDYNYNETYLENFCLEFIRFKKYVGIKHQIFVEIIKKIMECSQNLDLQLGIDGFWKYFSIDGKMSVDTNIDINKVCREKTLIKGTLMYENKRYLFLKEYTVIEHEKLCDKIDAQICNEFSLWLEGICNDEDKK